MHRTGPLRLLVIEDNAAYLYLIQRAFRDRAGKFRWELSVAEDGERALQIIFAEEENNAPLPDMILLDWKLPKVGGVEVLRRLKENDKTRRIPVLVFSTSEAESDIHTAYDNHANGYITKPGSADLLAIVVEAIEQFWAAVAHLPKAIR
jgi:chemotaxis family two-component system response regulator Rcp1